MIKLDLFLADYEDHRDFMNINIKFNGKSHSIYAVGWDGTEKLCFTSSWKDLIIKARNLIWLIVSNADCGKPTKDSEKRWFQIKIEGLERSNQEINLLKQYPQPRTASTPSQQPSDTTSPSSNPISKPTFTFGKGRTNPCKSGYSFEEKTGGSSFLGLKRKSPDSAGGEQSTKKSNIEK